MRQHLYVGCLSSQLEEVARASRAGIPYPHPSLVLKAPFVQSIAGLVLVEGIQENKHMEGLHQPFEMLNESQMMLMMPGCSCKWEIATV
jgi:hypothetical protein